MYRKGETLETLVQQGDSGDPAVKRQDSGNPDERHGALGSLI